MISVLVVDDHDLVRAGLAALLRAAPGFTVAGEAATGEDAVDLAAATRPDVVLLDIRLPGMDGITVATRMLTAVPPPRVLMMTMFEPDAYVYAAIRAGASGFLLKDTPPERIFSALRTVAAGDILLAPAAMTSLIETFGPAASSPPTSRLADLTPRETEVLTAVGRALSNTEIAARLHISEATVKTHLNRLMAKLGLCSRAQAVAIAYDTGLVTPRPT